MKTSKGNVVGARSGVATAVTPFSLCGTAGPVRRRADRAPYLNASDALCPEPAFVREHGLPVCYNEWDRQRKTVLPPVPPLMGTNERINYGVAFAWRFAIANPQLPSSQAFVESWA